MALITAGVMKIETLRRKVIYKRDWTLSIGNNKKRALTVLGIIDSRLIKEYYCLTTRLYVSINTYYKKTSDRVQEDT